VTAAPVTAITDLTDLTVNPVRAQAWVPFTAEYSEDYGAAAIASEIGRMIADAKDVVEAEKFVTGAAGGTVEPVGIYTVLLATAPGTGHATGRCMNVATFNLNGLDDQEGMLGARWRNSGRAAHIAALTTLQDYRQLGGAGQPSNSIYDQLSGTLHGYPAFEASYMPTWDTGDETGYDIFGDFQQFVIVDRLGLYTQFWPYVVDSNGVPLGQNGIYARWRNSSKVIVPEAFVLAVRDAD
jgi:HK97 family phage major capsid protein